MWRSFALSNQQVLRANSRKNGQYSSFIFNDSALAVLLAARNLIHNGWKLLGHPLYGNFRPHQQPYRTLLLQFNADAIVKAEGYERIKPDDLSLRLVEEAIAVYRNSVVLIPEQAPLAFRNDCAFLDFELMRLPLDQIGWPIDIAYQQV
jgi:hypothetical protein